MCGGRETAAKHIHSPHRNGCVDNSDSADTIGVPPFSLPEPARLYMHGCIKSLARAAGCCAYLILVTTGCHNGLPWWSGSAQIQFPSAQSKPTSSAGALVTAPPASPPIAPPVAQHSESLPVIETANQRAAAVVPASFGELTLEQPKFMPSTDNETVLCLPQFLEEVQERNPTLEAMAMAWRAAGEKYPQAVALDDPMFLATTAPDSLGHSSAESAYAFQLDQKFPWWGKRAAKGRAARADTDAAHGDLEDARLQLIETAQGAFFDYYLVRRQLELNRENEGILAQFRETALSKYRTNQATQQDVLQADLEVAQLERQKLELTRMDRVATARINTLLRQPPYAPLPPPPQQLASPQQGADVEGLMQIAASQRPDLAALAAKVRAAQAELTLAQKQYYPDVDVFGRYDTFWLPQNALTGQVGVNVNVPIYYGRLNAAVREAADEVSKRRAEYEQRLLDVQYSVVNAYEETEESRRAVELYSGKLIPAAEQNVDAARINYDVSKGSFLDLATAQRQLIELRQNLQQTLAEYHKRLASLEREIGAPLPAGPAMEKIPAPSPKVSQQ